MPFQPGNKLSPGGPRPNSGRPKSRKTQLKDFETAYPNAYYDLMIILYENGIKGISEDAKYVIDRLKGKPKAVIDQRNLNIDFTPDDYANLLPLLDATNTPLIPYPSGDNSDDSPSDSL